MNIPYSRIAKGAVGVVVLVILFSVVSRWYGEYRDTVSATANETTTTPTPGGEGETSGTAKPSKETTQLVVLVNGLNFRDQPSREGNKIRGLKEGERVTVVKSKTGWYYVQDSKGVRGWISSNKSYVKIVK